MLVAQSRRSIACAQNNHCPRVSGPNAFVLWIPHSPPPDTGTILNSIMAFQCARDGLYAMAHECRRLLHGVHSLEIGRVTRMSCGAAREGAGSARPWSKPGCRVWRYSLAVQPRARRAFCLYGGGREAAQPEPDLRQQSRPPITLTRIALERAAELHGEELIGAHIKSASGGKTDLAGFAKTRQSMDIIRMRKHLGTHGEVSNHSWERPSLARRGGGAAGRAREPNYFLWRRRPFQAARAPKDDNRLIFPEFGQSSHLINLTESGN